MGVEKQVILLQVGAEVDQSAFTKASAVVEASAKKIDKFSEEGIKLRKKEIETDWSGRG